ncbi:hypothetical protein ACIA8R_29545 [Nonomuraea sp. NPDC051191]|uniref:hypothetical protein n=1 Tax=Nonomuraea sp. NPDC051191 TaxID=3364372 RepID=UPI0037B7F82F
MADHLHAALIALLGTQGWGPAQAADAIAAARLSDCTLGRALLDHQEGTVRPTTVSRAQAEQVAAAIARQFGVPADEPKLMEEWWDGRQWSIYWDGPHEWTCYVPEGGPFAESDWTIPACDLPPGVRVEAVNACTLTIQPR